MAYVADRSYMVVARSRHGWHMVVKCQATFESDAKHFHAVGYGEVDSSDRYWRQRWDHLQLIGCSRRKYLGLVRIQLECVLHIPLLDSGGTYSENGQAIRCIQLANLSKLLQANSGLVPKKFRAKYIFDHTGWLTDSLWPAYASEVTTLWCYTNTFIITIKHVYYYMFRPYSPWASTLV